MSEFKKLVEAYGSAAHDFCLAKCRWIDFGREWDDREHAQSPDGLFTAKPIALAKNMRKAGEEYLHKIMVEKWEEKRDAFNAVMEFLGDDTNDRDYEDVVREWREQSPGPQPLSEAASIKCLLPGEAHSAQTDWLIYGYTIRYRIPESVFRNATKGKP